MRLFLSVLLIATLWGPAAPAQLPPGMPDYDVKGHCGRQSEMLGGGDFWMKACLTQEQESYNELKTIWDSVPQRVKRHCRQQTALFLASYFWLHACVAQELESGEAVKNFEFKK
jgi:hypothetical protein